MSFARIAQTVEQLFRKQHVAGSIPASSSNSEAWQSGIAPVSKTGFPSGIESSSLSASATSSRRAFLGFLAKGLAIGAVAPLLPIEEVLAFGSKTYFDMGALARPKNIFLFTDWVTQESLRILTNKMQMQKASIYSSIGDAYRDARAGDTIFIGIPRHYETVTLVEEHSSILDMEYA